MKPKTNIITRAEAQRLCPHKGETCHGRTVRTDGPKDVAVGFPCEPCIMDVLKAETDLFKLRFQYIERLIWVFGHDEIDMLLASKPETFVGYVKGANTLAKNTAALISSALAETDSLFMKHAIARLNRSVRNAAKDAREQTEVAHGK